MMSIGIQPLEDRIVLEVSEETQQSAGGIFIPDSAKEKPQQATVVAVGEGKYESGQLIPMAVSVGQQVLFSKYAGSDVKLNGKEYKIVRQSDLLAIVG